MKTFIKENKYLLTSFLVISITLPIIILLPSPIGVISYETGLTVIGYCGSIFGGFLTLYGVWWTLKNQEKQRHKDIALQYMPFIRCEVTNVKFKKFKGAFVVKFKNVGRGEAKKFHVNIYDPIQDIEIFSKTNDYIFMNTSPENEVELTIDCNYNKLLTCENKQTHTMIIISFEYTDLIYYATYKYSSKMHLNFDSNGFVDFYIEDMYQRNSIL